MSFVVIRDPKTAAHVHPVVIHTSRSEAEAEAKRLAEANRGTLFLVAIFVSGCELPKEVAKIVRYDDGSGAGDPWEIPF